MLSEMSGEVVIEAMRRLEIEVLASRTPEIGRAYRKAQEIVTQAESVVLHRRLDLANAISLKTIYGDLPLDGAAEDNSNGNGTGPGSTGPGGSATHDDGQAVS